MREKVHFAGGRAGGRADGSDLSCRKQDSDGAKGCYAFGRLMIIAC